MRMKLSLFTSLTQVCTSFSHSIWTAFKFGIELLIFPKHNFNNARVRQSVASVRTHYSEVSDHATLVAPETPSEISFTQSEQGRIVDLERQLSETISKQSKREKQVALLTSQLNTLLERAEAAAVAAESKQPDQRDLQLQSRDQALEEARSALHKASCAAEANEKSQRELTELRTELKTMKSESAAFRSRLANMENDKNRNQAATGPDMDKAINRISERIRALEVGQTSQLRHEKRLADVDNSNE